MAEFFAVVVGGVLATAGGGFTQWYLYKLKTKDDERGLQIDKLSELVAATYEYDHWLSNLRLVTVHGSETTEGINPFAKLFSTVHLYFPELESDLKELETTSDNYQQWMFSKGQERLAGKVETLTHGHMDACGPYIKARQNILSAIQKLSKSFSNK